MVVIHLFSESLQITRSIPGAMPTCTTVWLTFLVVRCIATRHGRVSVVSFPPFERSNAGWLCSSTMDPFAVFLFHPFSVMCSPTFFVLLVKNNDNNGETSTHKKGAIWCYALHCNRVVGVPSIVSVLYSMCEIIDHLTHRGTLQKTCLSRCLETKDRTCVAMLKWQHDIHCIDILIKRVC